MPPRHRAQAQARLLSAWPAGQPLPKADNLLTFGRGQAPLLNGQPLLELTDSQRLGRDQLHAAVRR